MQSQRQRSQSKKGQVMSVAWLLEPSYPPVRPRQVRIQFPGAVYHVMARGDRREAIFLDDEDRSMFLKALAEACGRTGWLCHGYVLMGNHYHLIIETPEANLVAGMAWLQNTFTRRHNVRHKLWGHLFGGRYKAVLVDDSNDGWYLPTLIDYVHLNPARAGLVTLKRGLEAFAWSSLTTGYLVSPSKRPPWLCADRGLAMRGLKDDAAGRRAYLRHLENRVRMEGLEAGRKLPEGQSLQSTLSRGWMFGAHAFKEKILALAGKSLESGSKRRNYGSAVEVLEHHLQKAEALLKRGLEVCELEKTQLADLPCGDERKGLIALAIKRETTVAFDWIAAQLQMGTRSTVSRVAGEVAKRLIRDRKLAQRYERIVTATEK